MTSEVCDSEHVDDGDCKVKLSIPSLTPQITMTTKLSFRGLREALKSLVVISFFSQKNLNKYF